MTPQLSKDLPQRFWDKVIVSRRTGCWLWTGSRNQDGYGVYQLRSWTSRKAHRVAYEALVGPVPEGFELDHVRARGCTSRGCVNPEHLEAVTHRENARRGDTGLASGARMKEKTHCLKGHLYDDANTYVDKRGWRQCLACKRLRLRTARHREVT